MGDPQRRPITLTRFGRRIGAAGKGAGPAKKAIEELGIEIVMRRQNATAKYDTGKLSELLQAIPPQQKRPQRLPNFLEIGRVLNWWRDCRKGSRA